MTILQRVLAPLNYKGCIEAFNQCNTGQSIALPSASALLQFHSAKKRENTKRFQAHRLKIKLKNKSNVNI